MAQSQTKLDGLEPFYGWYMRVSRNTKKKKKHEINEFFKRN